MTDIDYQALQALLGPKRVKTKEVEIEAHDLTKIQSLHERRGVKPVTFGQFPGTYVVPKDPNPICPDDYKHNDYDYYLD